VLRRIHADSDNLFHERSPLSEINNNDLSLARSMPPGAVHTNKVILLGLGQAGGVSEFPSKAMC
jgi:hypothetical protein